MSALSIQPPFPIITDTDGSPLENGYIWIGTVNQPAQTSAINVYWDAALTIQATQPIRTTGGYPSRNGSPARLYVDSDYSILVQNKNGSFVYSAPAATERFNAGAITSLNASQVVYDPAGTGAVATTVQAKLRETVSVKDFGAVGDGVTDDRTAIQNAINAASAMGGGMVQFESGKTYAVDSTTRPYLSLPSNVGLDLNWCTLQRIGTNYTHPFIENANSGGMTYNHIIRNGTIRGTGAPGQVSGQGHAILMFNATNVLIENIKTENTNGDGIAARFSYATTIRDCEIGDYGRNGISPTSGEFVYDNLVISGTPISGASPAVPFDAENDSATERGVHTILYIKCAGMTFVDFYNTAGATFGHDIYFVAGDVGPGFLPFRILSKGGNTTANKIFIGPNVTIKPTTGLSDTGVQIEDTNNIVLAGCTIQRQTASGTQRGVQLIDTVDQLVMNNVNFAGDFNFDYDVEASGVSDELNNSHLTGVFRNVYLRGSNNRFNGEIYGNITVAGAGTTDNIFPERTGSATTVSGGSLAAQSFGGTRGIRSKTYYSDTVTIPDGATYDLTLPVPSAAAAGSGRLLFIAAGYSHTGSVSHWAQYLGTVRLGTNGTVEANVISQTGAAGKSIAVLSATTTSVTLRLTYQFGGVFSATVLG